MCLLQGACRERSASHDVVSLTRGEYRWPRADAFVHKHNRACAVVIHLHSPRVSQLLLQAAHLRALQETAQGWNNRTLAVHERVDSRFLVFPGSE